MTTAELLPPDGKPAARPLRGLGKAFGDLRVRTKLVLLHNLFFAVLALAVYLAVIPPYQERMAAAAAREAGLVARSFDESGVRRLEGYAVREGTAEEAGVPAALRPRLDARPGAVQRAGEFLYRKDPDTGQYGRVALPYPEYREALGRARWLLVAALGLVYALAVLALEAVILPTYVYRPLRLMLDADAATQRGDHAHELIPERLIAGDEIGQIMRSRNQTIAQLRKHEQELAEALTRLETAKQKVAEQDRLASLGLISAGVAHELNSPLAVLHGSIEKLLETVPDAAAQQRLARMLKVAGRLRRISESLLDFARIRPQAAVPVAIRGVVDEAWQLVSLDDKAGGVRFTNNVPPGQLVTGNSDRLVQVFVNLLRNSLLAVKSSGIILVQSRALELDTARWVEITVEDDGSGIPPHVLPQIFEAFVTTRLDARGTGLGLAVAEGIVEQHGGTIEASNRAGGGACLTLRLPAAPSSAANRA